LVANGRRADPDVIENHNLHGFDLPFLERRARELASHWRLGPHSIAATWVSARGPPWRAKPHRRASGASHRAGPRTHRHPRRRARSRLFTRDLPSHGLKAVARHFGIAGPRSRDSSAAIRFTPPINVDPERVRRYASAT
jgi:DNA polymerase I